jgi:uncharacterized membrane protein YphA (DoxX/SURF4 family)
VPVHIRSTAPAAVFLRLALAAGFLSAVADRFGLWGPPGTPGVGWGGFDPFLAYTGELLWFLPTGLVPAAGWAATVLEVLLAVGLLAGVRLRAFALASGLLLTVFALAMTVALGPEPPLSYSVWSAAAGAFLLASSRPNWEHDEISAARGNEVTHPDRSSLCSSA